MTPLIHLRCSSCRLICRAPPPQAVGGECAQEAHEAMIRLGATSDDAQKLWSLGIASIAALAARDVATIRRATGMGLLPAKRLKQAADKADAAAAAAAKAEAEELKRREEEAKEAELRAKFKDSALSDLLALHGLLLEEVAGILQNAGVETLADFDELSAAELVGEGLPEAAARKLKSTAEEPTAAFSYEVAQAQATRVAEAITGLQAAVGAVSDPHLRAAFGATLTEADASLSGESPIARLWKEAQPAVERAKEAAEEEACKRAAARDVLSALRSAMQRVPEGQGPDARAQRDVLEQAMAVAQTFFDEQSAGPDAALLARELAEIETSVQAARQQLSADEDEPGFLNDALADLSVGQ